MDKKLLLFSNKVTLNIPPLNKTTFVIFETRYNGLSKLLRDPNYTQTIMGEIRWFYSLIKNLESKNQEIVHCANENNFLLTYNKLKKNGNKFFLIMDFKTIPQTIKHLSESLDKVFCLCYWGRNSNSIKELGSINNKYISLKNVLTPFNYSDNNTYLGFDMTVLCKQINKKIYKNIGLLWGKNLDCINQKLVKYLTEKGIEFYCVSNEPVSMNGVINLGIVSKDLWLQLLHDVKFILGSGNPPSGPTIYEALFYKTPLVGPSSQFPKATHNQNIHFINNLEYEDIFKLLDGISFKEDNICNDLCSKESFDARIKNIFKI